VTSALNMLVRTTSDLETNIVSVERVKEYAEIETEVKCIRVLCWIYTSYYFICI